MAFGIAIIAAGILAAAFILFGEADPPVPAWIAALPLAGGGTLGGAAVLCWKNQGIRMLDGGDFEYTTMFGVKKTFRFYEITGVKYNADSMTVFAGEEKIHVESCAIVTERLADALQAAIDKTE